jgi:hypothetical protein
MPKYAGYLNVDVSRRKAWGGYLSALAAIVVGGGIGGGLAVYGTKLLYPEMMTFTPWLVAVSIFASMVLGALVFAAILAPHFGRFARVARLAQQDVAYPLEPMPYMTASEEDLADAEADERARRYAGEYGEAVDFVVWAARNFLTRQATRDEPAALAKLHDGVTELDVLDRALGLVECIPDRAEYIAKLEALADVARRDMARADATLDLQRAITDLDAIRDAAAVRAAPMESDLRDWMERGDAAARERLEGAMGVSLT